MIYGIGLAALCLAWLWPGHYLPWTGFQQETVAATGGLLIALACVVSTGRDALKVPAVALGALVLALVPLVQWATGEVDFLIDALLPALYLFAFSLTIVAACALAQRDRDRFVVAIMVTLLAGATASCVIGLGQGLRLGWESNVEQLGVNGRVFANFTQPNHLATLLGTGLVATWWLYESRHVGGLSTLLLGAFLSLGLAMTQSRIGWGFFFFFALWWAISRSQLRLRTSPLGLAGATMIFVIATASWPVLSNWIDGSAVVTAVDRVQSFGGRRQLWPVLWDAAWRQPWLGWGWMQVSAAQQAAALDHAASYEWVTYSHSLVLDFLIWNGIPIGVIALAAVAWWITTRVRCCSELGTWAMLAAGGVIFVHALVEFPYAYAYFLLPLGVFVGVVEARTSANHSAVMACRRSAFAVAVTFMTFMLSWLCMEYLEVEEMARRARFREAGYVAAPGEQASPPAVVLIDSQREFIRFILSSAKPGMAPEQLEAIRRINRHFMAPPVMLRHALAMGLNGQPAEATHNLRLLCQIWAKRYCDQGRETWSQAQEKYPQLTSIAFPKKGE